MRSTTKLLLCVSLLSCAIGCTDDPDLTESSPTDGGETDSEVAVEETGDTSSDDTGSELDSTIDDSGIDSTVDSGADSGADSTIDAAADSVSDSGADSAMVDSTVLDSAMVDSAMVDTGAEVDVGPPPSVSSTLPLDGRVGVSTATVVKVTFSEPMKASTLVAQATSGACTGSFQLLAGPAFTSCIGGTLASTDGITFTFTPAAALGIELRHKVQVTSAAQGADGRAITAYSMASGFKTQRFPVDAKVLYMSGARQGNFGGAAGGDTICTTLASRPVGVVSGKAMVTDATRTACTVANCGAGNVQTNWVLKPNQHYVRADGAYLFITDAKGIFTAYPGANDMGTGLNFWDGLNADWTTRAPNCTDWTSTAGNGAVGYDVVLNNLWLTGGQLPCTSARSFVCAEQ